MSGSGKKNPYRSTVSKSIAKMKKRVEEAQMNSEIAAKEKNPRKKLKSFINSKKELRSMSRRSNQKKKKPQLSLGIGSKDTLRDDSGSQMSSHRIIDLDCQKSANYTVKMKTYKGSKDLGGKLVLNSKRAIRDWSCSSPRNKWTG
jgi:hypothetical protein